jgi:hypothetical protein
MEKGMVDGTMEQAATRNGTGWDLEADVVVIGSGAAGLPAAIKADGGASVIIVETNYDVGGHAILSGEHMALGGETARRKNTASRIHLTPSFLILPIGRSSNPTVHRISAITTGQ